jgi:hypothetical protein
LAVAAPADLAVITGLHPDRQEIWSATVWFRFLPVLLALGSPDDLSPGTYRPARIILGRTGDAGAKTLEIAWQENGTHEALALTRSGSIEGWAQLP